VKYALIILLLVVIAVLGYLFLPYSLSDFKRIEAINLRAQIRSWQKLEKPASYGYTKSYRRCYVTSTNIYSGTNRIQGVMVLESSHFQHRGCLVATDSGEVYWYDGKTAQLVR
jgi:hypothetical protein